MKKNRKEPMPLSDLPDYIKSIRNEGQGDYVPVVDMGMIVTNDSSWLRSIAYATAMCVAFSLCVVFIMSSTRDICITSDASSNDVVDLISQDGYNVISVKQNENGDYKLRVFTFSGSESLIERLRKNKGFKKVEIEN